jgi:anthranilate synthase component I
MQARSCILVASSPEILCRVDQQREVTNRPLAGTRKRGETEKEDSDLEEELLADEKERAEHIMLVDLGRNDVGRVAEAGSVNVEKLMEIERYSHVMHISSTVKGQLLSALITVCMRLQMWIGRESCSFVVVVIVDAGLGQQGGFLILFDLIELVN